MLQSLCSSSCVTMFRSLSFIVNNASVRQQKMRRKRRHHPIPIRQLKERMQKYIIAKIKPEETQHDKAQAMVQHDNANGSITRKDIRASDNIRALRRAIMNVERAMELDDQMGRYAI